MSVLRKPLTAAALAGVMASAGAIQAAAAPIDLTGTRVQGQNVTLNYNFGSVTCSIGCLGVLSDGSLSANQASALDLANANPGTEASTLSDILGLVGADRFTASDTSRENNGSSPFDFTGLYVALKIGQMTAYLFNSAGVEQTVTYSGNPAGGLSHKTAIGELTPVPLPAAAWMLLAGLGGLGLLARRRAA